MVWVTRIRDGNVGRWHTSLESCSGNVCHGKIIGDSGRAGHGSTRVTDSGWQAVHGWKAVVTGSQVVGKGAPGWLTDAGQNFTGWRRAG